MYMYSCIHVFVHYGLVVEERKQKNLKRASKRVKAKQHGDLGAQTLKLGYIAYNFALFLWQF